MSYLVMSKLLTLLPQCLDQTGSPLKFLPSTFSVKVKTYSEKTSLKKQKFICKHKLILGVLKKIQIFLLIK